MKRDYQSWHTRKSTIEVVAGRPFFHEREIWFCHLGANIGFEQDGQGTEFLRPVLIVRKFNNEIAWGIPLTKSKVDAKRSSSAQAYYFSFSFVPGIQSEAILSQIRLIDVRRLDGKMGEISTSDFVELKKRLKALLP